MIKFIKLLIYVYFLDILMAQPIPITAADISSTYSDQNLDKSKAGSQVLCFNSLYTSCTQLHCSQGEPRLKFGYCVTLSESTGLLSLSKCPSQFQTTSYNVTSTAEILLPRNLSQLNDYMCGPLNRKGLVCSECADGFGPSVTSFGYRCVKCTDAWYKVPLVLVLEFVPITILYLINLTFLINITSAPMPCFIMFAQFIVITFDSSNLTSPLASKLTMGLKNNLDLGLDINIILLFYRIYNLEFGRYLSSPLCISRDLKSIHMTLIGYISAFYSLYLIFLTWICVELHGRNFRLLVWLWRPFHRCFIRLRRGWNPTHDLIDVFTAFFILSYGKILHQTLLLAAYDEIMNIDASGEQFTSYTCLVDQNISYGGKYHLLFVIPAGFVTLVFNILPPLLLTFYPIKTFRLCLSKCRMDSIGLCTFADKIHGCYRNGLDGG